MYELASGVSRRAHELDAPQGEVAESHRPVRVGYVETYHQILNGLPEQAALIGGDGTILAVNEAWAENAALNGFSDFRPGANYYREIALVADAGYGPAREVVEALKEFRQHKRTSFRLVYEGAGHQAGRQFEARITALKLGDEDFLTVTRYDITELLQLRSLRDGLSDSLRKTQEDERRRFGRELHDSGLQLLVCLSLALGQLKRARSVGERKAVTADMEELLVEAHREFRAISYLAHPPQLEKLPLLDALRMLIDGFGQRAGLVTTFEADEISDALSHDAEHTLYRVVQEAISNVHRHARAKKLSVRVVTRGEMLHVLVEDDGRGIPEDIRDGVGLSGMRARMREIGGRLTILRQFPGTGILASVSLLAEASNSPGTSA